MGALQNLLSILFVKKRLAPGYRGGKDASEMGIPSLIRGQILAPHAVVPAPIRAPETQPEKGKEMTFDETVEAVEKALEEAAATALQIRDERQRDEKSRPHIGAQDAGLAEYRDNLIQIADGYTRLAALKLERKRYINAVEEWHWQKDPVSRDTEVPAPKSTHCPRCK